MVFYVLVFYVLIFFCSNGLMFYVLMRYVLMFFLMVDVLCFSILCFRVLYSVLYRGWKGHFGVYFYLKHSAGCFKYQTRCFNNPAGWFFVRPDVCLDNSFGIQYQNTRPDLSDNLIISLLYLVCKLCSRTIRPGIYDTYRNKNQITGPDALNYPVG